MEFMIEEFGVIYLAFSILQMIAAAVMCIFGYKWSKGLIATVAMYIGVVLGFFFAGFAYAKLDFDSGICIVIFIATILLFDIMAYKNIKLNHFLAGFIVAVKLSFLLILQIMKLNIDFGGWMFIAPIIVGIIFGIIVVCNMNNKIMIICTAYIGSTTFITEAKNLFQNIEFARTGDFTIFTGDSPEAILLNMLGIEVPTFLEFLIIIAAFLISYYIQKKSLERMGLSLTDDIIIDDRNLET